MKEHPILMCGDMVRATLADRKTQTRRVVKGVTRCPYGAAGDHLWVRETWRETGTAQRADGKIPTRDQVWGNASQVRYAADDPTDGPWRPSIFMPRWASRITLEIVSVRAERVQEITELDAEDEGVGAGFQCNSGWPDYQHIGKDGVCSLTQDSPRMSFATLWDSLNAKRGFGFDVNPWCWRI